jgi:hypothetical protein
LFIAELGMDTRTGLAKLAIEVSSRCARMPKLMVSPRMEAVSIIV